MKLITRNAGIRIALLLGVLALTPLAAFGLRFLASRDGLDRAKDALKVLSAGRCPHGHGDLRKNAGNATAACNVCGLKYEYCGWSKMFTWTRIIGAKDYPTDYADLVPPPESLGADSVRIVERFADGCQCYYATYTVAADSPSDAYALYREHLKTVSTTGPVGNWEESERYMTFDVYGARPAHYWISYGELYGSPGKVLQVCMYLGEDR